ncbi:hypothetical protein K4K54_007833 [Colletotrichum sp. SAR 10_86]|nr:hypothetical protein KHU50_007683 [Colletotrichum sp. SAR 10_65]KAI8176387.1 hypothetical protein K4K51_006470 [Colletotrichum sp. SAR 10_75]KAI8219836.1 hypothetical protein K4K53_007980 [Colletotrichum sp. SAR 10_77]KAI8221435.1 hypothetical protein K4K54_007833 [Colletotrichum sp. SAR 10_86]KAJ5005050.1 hypothetical protein K4K48_008255 [Colletotrichum sp. SAR 10_66]
MSYNNRGPPGSNGRRPDLQQYSPALTARTQDTFSASTAQNSYNRGRFTRADSAYTKPFFGVDDAKFIPKRPCADSAYTKLFFRVDDASPASQLDARLRWRKCNNATALTFQVVDDRAHDAMAKLLREKQVRIIPGGFRVQQQQRPADRPTPKELATLMNGMLQDAEDFAYQMERLSKEDGEVCGQLACHSTKMMGMLKELFVLGWHMQRGKDDLVERWRVDHNTGRPQPSGRALR